MPQPDHISVLGVPDPAMLDDDLKAIWAKCVEKLGFVPNVYATYSLKPQRLRNFMAIIVFLANFRLVIENLLKYGVLVSPVMWARMLYPGS